MESSGIGDTMSPIWYSIFQRIPSDLKKIAYLLLFGELPSAEEAKDFSELLAAGRELPTNFTRDVIMKASSKDIMNSMTRSILYPCLLR